jgi:hypothetical protein
MMKIKRALILTSIFLLVFALQARAQIEPTEEVDPNANISWPPPVYVLRGEFTLRGSANLANMVSYFIEYRQLNDDLSPQADNVPWIPATLPSSAPVLNDVLGVWNTATEEDGVYEVRLNINIQGDEPVFARVSPVRLENSPPPFAITPTATPGLVLPTIAPQPTTNQAVPTLLPTPTAFDPTPRVTPNRAIDVNIRSGDNTNYPIVGSLNEGESATILGISNTGSGWYRVQLANGTIGWVAGGVVTVTGDISGVPRVSPPATPTPIATPTPVLPDVTITGLRYDRGQIRQGEAFQIIVTVRNTSGVFMPDTQLLCTIKPMNVETSANTGSLNAFEQRDVVMPARTLTTGGGGNVTVDCAVDVNRLVAEIDDNNNYFSITTPLLAP